MARVAHLYYVLGLTQSEIADRVSVTRFKVNRILAQARAQGMVRIEIDVPFHERLNQESRLVERFGLESAFVCPSESVPDISLSEIIGRYAANVAASMLFDGATVATSWGETLHRLAQSIDPSAARNLSVVSMIGSLATRSSQDRFEAASVLAERLGAECFYLPGPMLCDSIAAKDAINAQPAAQKAMQMAKSADIALLSIGGAGMSSIRAATILSDDAYRRVVEAGAIGNFLGRFIGPTGAPLEHEMNTRCIGIGPEDIDDIPCRILCAGGAAKVAAVRAVLKRGKVTTLVTDSMTAEGLLAPAA
ncbi:MAG: sugar-binding domain-containing protein [Crocosphaera sp.]|nr:sugar-binding domain-containing protein [Crocosphaera sp.]